MNNLKIFNNPQFGEVRVVMNADGEPLFCLSDVCKVLGIQAKHVKERLEKDVVSTDTLLTPGGEQLMNFVNEDGLYDVILDSRKKEAKMFRKWVTSEVLPSIRKTGGYIVAKADETEEELMARAFLVAQSTIERQKEKLKSLEESNAALSQQMAENMPKVTFANAVLASQTSCLVGELAKILTQNGYEIGQNRLFDYLRKEGYLGTQGERRNVPNQRFVEMGLFELKKSVRSGSDGTLHSVVTTKVTPRGQSYFINKLLKSL